MFNEILFFPGATIHRQILSARVFHFTFPVGTSLPHVETFVNLLTEKQIGFSFAPDRNLKDIVTTTTIRPEFVEAYEARVKEIDATRAQALEDLTAWKLKYWDYIGLESDETSVTDYLAFIPQEWLQQTPVFFFDEPFVVNVVAQDDDLWRALKRNISQFYFFLPNNGRLLTSGTS